MPLSLSANIMTNSRLLLLLFTVLLLCAPHYSTFAQATSADTVQKIPSLSAPLTGNLAQEMGRQVSFDYGGKLMRLTWEFEKQFAVLRSYPYLHEARLFQTGDSAYLLEVKHIVNGKIEQDLKSLTMQEVSSIRYASSEALRDFTMWGNEDWTAGFEDWALGAGTAVWGLGFGSQVDIQYRSQVQFPVAIITSASSLGIHIWAAHQPWYNRSSAVMWTNGLLQGAAHGLALDLLFSANSVRNSYLSYLIAVLGGVSEAGIGLGLPHWLGLRPAQTQLITAFGATGIIASFFSQYLYAYPFGNYYSQPLSDYITGTSVLLASAMGYWIGNEVGKSTALTGGDALVMTTPTNILTTVPPAIIRTYSALGHTQVEKERAAVALGFSIGAILSGHFIGAELVKDKDFSYLQGRVITASSGIGSTAMALFGLDLMNRVSQGSALSIVLPVANLLAGAIGFTIPYLIYAKDAEEQHQRRLTATGAQASADLPPRIVPSERTWFENLAANTDVQFSPLGMLPALSPHAGLGIMGAGVPIMSIRTILGNPAPKPRLEDEINEVH